MYQAFQHAYKQEKNLEAILRELAGVCLELGRFDQAVIVGESSLALDPRNVELIGNLAVALLLVGRQAHARKAIDAAIKLNANDSINQRISRIVSEVEDGRRDLPKSLQEFSGPVKKKKWWLFSFPWK